MADSRETSAAAQTPSPAPPTWWGRALRILGGVFLGLVFLAAARLKTVDMAEAREPIAFSLGTGRETTTAILYVLLTYEIGLGLLLLSGWKRRQVVGAATATLVAYTLFLLYLAMDPEAPGCACFGAQDYVDAAQRTNLLGAARNVLLIAVAATVYLSQRNADRKPAPFAPPPDAD